MKNAHKLLNILLILAITICFLDVLFLHRDLVSATSATETHINSLGNNYYQYYELDESINKYPLKKSIQRFITKHEFSFNNDGYLIFRILINKNGKAELLSFSQLDEKLNPITAELDHIEDIKSFLINNCDWQKGFINGKIRKYHQKIQFKIVKGQINEIY
ncbi:MULTISPECIES: hypothetical protein [Sphingobacterium]|uniref:hypothetical protein n=1 Tax=Sphingobacterium TaxID=28453 RepID=UPI0016197320|nr:hypothetical protein [Sphingobacterium sp. JUb56]MBB2951246.1 hypothetical protein [Sphingobacterium sp. JUb56]